MFESKIPEKETENVLSMYWQMLRELEAHRGRDIGTKLIIDGAYKVLNRCGVTDAKPQYR